MVKNVTNLTIMNEDLHVFIPQDLIPLGQSEYTPSFEQFVFTIQDIAMTRLGIVATLSSRQF